MLVDELELAPDDLYAGAGFTAFSDLFQLYAALDVPRLKDPPMPPRPLPAFDGSSDVWSAIRNGDILAHHPYHSLRRGDPLRERGRGGSPGARHQDDALPGEPDLADRARPHPGRRERQGGRGPRRAAGALRRGGEHPLGARARGSRRARRLRAGRLQDPLQGLPRRPPGTRRDPALLPPGDRQLQRPHRRDLRRLRSLHLPGVLRRGRDRAVQHADRLHAPAPLPAPAGGAHRSARRLPRLHPPRGGARPARPARAHHGQDERPGGPRP